MESERYETVPNQKPNPIGVSQINRDASGSFALHLHFARKKALFFGPLRGGSEFLNFFF